MSKTLAAAGPVELDKAELEAFELSAVWVDVTDDDPPYSPIPPEKRYKCYVTFSAKAKWAIGELALGKMTCNKSIEFKTVDNIGDFNRLKEATCSGTFYVGNSYFPGFRNGGPVDFLFEVVTQTTAGKSELEKKDGIIVDRVRLATQLRKTIVVPAPPAPAAKAPSFAPEAEDVRLLASQAVHSIDTQSGELLEIILDQSNSGKVHGAWVDRTIGRKVSFQPINGVPPHLANSLSQFHLRTAGKSGASFQVTNVRPVSGGNDWYEADFVSGSVTLRA